MDSNSNAVARSILDNSSISGTSLVKIIKAIKNEKDWNSAIRLFDGFDLSDQRGILIELLAENSNNVSRKYLLKFINLLQTILKVVHHVPIFFFVVGRK